jgi:hypothetical protein
MCGRWTERIFRSPPASGNVGVGLAERGVFMNAFRQVAILPLLALLLAGCGIGRPVPPTALDCADLGIDVPASAPRFDDRRSPVLLNDDTVGATARSLYRVPWQRIARLKVLVGADGKVSHACVDQTSVDSAFDRVALEASEVARFRPAGGAAPAPAWTELLVVAQAERLPAKDGRYLPIAFPDTLDPRFESESVLALQAAVLNYLVAHNNGHDRRGPNRGVCVGVGPFLPIFDPPESLMARLVPASLPLHAASACAIDRRYPEGWPSRLVLKSEGAPAIALWVDIAEPHDGMAEVRAGYFEGGLSGADYRCRVRVVNRDWTVDRCEVTAVS